MSVNTWPKFTYQDPTCRKRCRDIQDILSDDAASSEKYSRIIALLDDHETEDWSAWGEKIESHLKSAVLESAPAQRPSLPGGRMTFGEPVPMQLAAGQACEQGAASSTSTSSAATAPVAVFNVANVHKLADVIEQNRQKALATRAEKQAFAQQQANNKEMPDKLEVPL